MHIAPPSILLLIHSCLPKSLAALYGSTHLMMMPCHTSSTTWLAKHLHPPHQACSYCQSGSQPSGGHSSKALCSFTSTLRALTCSLHRQLSLDSHAKHWVPPSGRSWFFMTHRSTKLQLSTPFCCATRHLLCLHHAATTSLRD